MNEVASVQVSARFSLLWPAINEFLAMVRMRKWFKMDQHVSHRSNLVYESMLDGMTDLVRVMGNGLFDWSSIP